MYRAFWLGQRCTEQRTSWHLQMALRHDICRWPYVMTFADGLTSWHLQMALRHDICRWPYVVTFADGLTSWHLQMALRHDICRWPCTWIKLHNTHISHAINFIIWMSIFLYNDVQSSAVVTRSIIVRYCINDWRTQEEYQSDGGPTKYTEYFALKVRAMVFWENYWEMTAL